MPSSITVPITVHGPGTTDDIVPISVGPDPEAVYESAILESVQIGSLLDARLRMKDTITLIIEKDEGTYVATYEELEEYGCGDDALSAVDAFRQALSIAYWSLKEEQDNLGPHLAEIWHRLSNLVYEA